MRAHSLKPHRVLVHRVAAQRFDIRTHPRWHSAGAAGGPDRHGAGGRTGVHAGLLDVLHDAADDDVAVLIAQRVHVQLVRAVQVLIYQHRAVRVHLHRVLDVALQVRVAARARDRNENAEIEGSPMPQTG